MNYPTYGWAWLSAQGQPARCRNNTLLIGYSTWNRKKATVFLCQHLPSRSTSDISFLSFFLSFFFFYRQKLTRERCSAVWQFPPGVTKFGKCSLPFSFCKTFMHSYNHTCYKFRPSILRTNTRNLLTPPPLPHGQGFLIIEASRSHSDTQYSAGPPLTRDQPYVETSTWKHTTIKRDGHQCPQLNSNPQS